MMTVTKLTAENQYLIPKKLRTAAYARVSTNSNEQLQSFNAQVEYYSKLISSNSSYEFMGVYADEGISGTKKDNRFELLRLLSDCENKKVDFIITKSISRFARNTTDCLEIVRRLTQLGVGILFEKENINTKTMDNELILSILSSLAAEESKSISQNTSWSIVRRFKNGTYKLANTPYGYDFNGKTLVPNHNQKIVVQRIFALYISGLGTRAIATRLNSDNIPTVKGGKWSESSLLGILENEKYIGDVIHQKTYTDANFNKQINNGEKDKVYLQNNHEPIVSREDFETVANIRKQRASGKGRNNRYQTRYAFSSVIECGECGSTFKRRIHYANKPYSYVAWCCKNHIATNGKKCSMLYIRDEHIKQTFVDMVNNLYENREKILKPMLTIKTDQDRVLKVAKINKRIDELVNQEKAIVEMYTKGLIDSTPFFEKQSTLQTELANLRESRAIIGTAIEAENAALFQTKILLKHLANLENFDDEMFKQLCKKVIVFSPTEVGFELKNGLVLREIIERG